MLKKNNILDLKPFIKNLKFLKYKNYPLSFRYFFLDNKRVEFFRLSYRERFTLKHLIPNNSDDKFVKLCDELCAILDRILNWERTSINKKFFFIKQICSKIERIVIFEFLYKKPRPDYTPLLAFRGKSHIEKFFNAWLSKLFLLSRDGIQYILSICYKKYELNKYLKFSFKEFSSPKIMNPTFLDSIGNSTKNLLTKYELGENFQKQRYTPTILQINKGPNGSPAWATSFLDFLALSKDPQLLKLIEKLGQLIYHGYDSTLKYYYNISLNHINKINFKKKQYYHSKIMSITDHLGKIRVTGVGDYLSHETLMPIHNHLINILKRMTSDLTFNELEAVRIIQIWQFNRQKTWSYSISSSKEHFPTDLIKQISTKIFGEEIAEAWLNVLTNRKFKYNQKNIEYKCGLPLGFPSSWPFINLMHHVIVRYCEVITKTTPKSSYIIVGDEVIIVKKEVARFYEKITDELGIKLTVIKPMTPFKSFRLVAKFNKKIIVDSLDVSPIPLLNLKGSMWKEKSLYNIISKSSEWKKKSFLDIYKEFGQRAITICFLLNPNPDTDILLKLKSWKLLITLSDKNIENLIKTPSIIFNKYFKKINNNQFIENKIYFSTKEIEQILKLNKIQIKKLDKKLLFTFKDSFFLTFAGQSIRQFLYYGVYPSFYSRFNLFHSYNKNKSKHLTPSYLDFIESFEIYPHKITFDQIISMKTPLDNKYIENKIFTTLNNEILEDIDYKEGEIWWETSKIVCPIYISFSRDLIN